MASEAGHTTVAGEAAPPTGTAGKSDVLLSVTDLTVTFPHPSGRREVISQLSYSIPRGKTLGVVGESGCGKSMTALSLLGLVPFGGQVSGSVVLDDRELIGQSKAEWRNLRGRLIAMIFQEPMTALNPVMTVGQQIGEVLVRHFSMTWGTAIGEAVRLLEAVGIPSPAQRAKDFPHQLSGGQRQRAMIAMALACRPALLVADEPTTALDVTIQAQILDLMIELQDEIGMSIQFISHNLAVVSELSDTILVMYAGRAVEYAPAHALFENPRHPYTRGLIATLPDPKHRVDRLPVIEGTVPSHYALLGGGCRFASRCPLAIDKCRAAEPALEAVSPDHLVACFRAGE